MAKARVDLTGQRFGKLIAIKLAGGSSPLGGKLWFCQCDCGSTTIARSVSLRDGGNKSCGCLIGKSPAMLSHLPKGEAALNFLIAGYKVAAEKKNLPYKLSRELFRKLTKKRCFYCGLPPSSRSWQKTYNGSYSYNGLDRVDNTKGYTEDNVVPCCRKCNYMKRKMTLDEFRKQILLIVRNWIKDEK